MKTIFCLGGKDDAYLDDLRPMLPFVLSAGFIRAKRESLGKETSKPDEALRDFTTLRFVFGVRTLGGVFLLLLVRLWGEVDPSSRAICIWL